MTRPARLLAIAAAIAVVVGAGWWFLGQSDSNVAAPAASPSATPTSSVGTTVPGRVRLREGPWAMTIEVPDGWTFDGVLTSDSADTGFALWKMIGAYVDPCTDHTLRQPIPTTGEELVAALANQPGTTAGPITDVTVDGYSGKVFDLTVATDIARCGDNGFWIWASPDVGGARYVQGNEEMNRIYVLDVNGEPYTFFARIPAGTSAVDLAEVEQMIASIDIE